MASAMSKETAKIFIQYVKENEPYPLSVLDDLMFDDKRFDDGRVLATEILKKLLDAGYSEDEVNPWKDKH